MMSNYADKSATTTAAAITIAAIIALIAELDSAAAVNGEVYGSRRLHQIGGNGAIIASATDDLSRGSVDSRTDNGVLVGLRSAQAQGLILALERVNLALHHEVHKSAIIGILIVNDVAGAALDRIAQIAELGRKVVVHAINGALSLAAAILHRIPKIAESLLVLIAQSANRVVYSVEATHDGIVQRVGAVTNTLLDTADSVGDIVQGKSLRNGVLDAATSVSAATASVTTAAKAAEATATEQQGKQDNAPESVAVEHTTAAVATATAAVTVLT